MNSSTRSISSTLLSRFLLLASSRSSSTSTSIAAAITLRSLFAAASLLVSVAAAPACFCRNVCVNAGSRHVLEPPPPVFYSARTALEEASKAELCPVGFWGPNCTNCPGLRLEFSNVSAAERVVTIYDAAGASSSVQLDGTKACSNHGVCVNSGTLADKYADGTDVNPEDRCACDRGYEGDACDRAAADEPAAFLPLIVVVMGFFAFGLMVCVLRLWEACRVRSSGHFRVGEADVFAVAVALYCAMRAGSTAGDAHGANSGTDDHSAVNTDAMLVHAATSPHRP